MDDEEEEVGLTTTGWVIPHHTALDYCRVEVIGGARDGRVRVEGHRHHGWNPDGALVRCRINPDKMTQTPSWHTDFLALYEDPCHPKDRSESHHPQ
ncbi:hypothetical protein LAV_00166 [Sphingobium phage Lacusarx]|uniref:Uncharacterized protein n=1 Tax=Sphingobium phage Lacusarx TaxID=1980139 RepID=A0A1W6DXB9_9CAUD|nr:hypothetical protein FDH44_gp137 [Sphingobium phage Lacusarx]ARK07541.1 hypothetical protein LAV_00166 [Sphingobium phage Lacusarx]